MTTIIQELLNLIIATWHLQLFLEIFGIGIFCVIVALFLRLVRRK